MRSVSFYAAACLLAAVAVGPAQAAGVLADPSDNTMCLLYYKVANQPPPLDDFAAKAVAVRGANEFDKQKAIDAEKARLQALFASLSMVTAVRMNLDMQMGQYDSDHGEYDLTGFSADQFLQFWCFNSVAVRLRFDNGSDAQIWSLDPKSAEAALNKNGGNRDVIATTTIDLTGVDSATPGDPLMLVGNVSEVSLEGQFNHAPLGHYSVKAQ